MSEVRKLNILVVDDEASARDGLKRMLAAFDGVEKVDTSSNGIEAIKYLTGQKTDLLLLDIQMPLVDGFDVLRSIPKEDLPIVVFVTAFDEYAVKAFEFHALDYILKPFSDKRLRDVIDRVQNLLHEQDQVKQIESLLLQVKPKTESEIVHTDSEKQLVFKEDGVVRFLEYSEIEWIEAFDYYVKLHVKDKVHLIRTSIKKMLADLIGDEFIRVHRSAIINTKEIASIYTKSGEWAITLKSGAEVKVGRMFKDNIKMFMND